MMAFRWLALGTVALLSAPSMSWGQTVQLPTFRHTTVSTTVLVPDRGSTSLGGFSGSSSGSNSRGIPGGAGPLFRSRSVGRSSGASNMSVHVTIIDHQLWDDAVMASACLPYLFKAVEIDGEAYWDGGYMGNPALFPFFDGSGGSPSSWRRGCI